MIALQPARNLPGQRPPPRGRPLQAQGLEAPAAGPFEFTSSVDASLWKDVEALFYFHPRQRELVDPIKACIDRFGVPEILRRGRRVYLGIPQNDAQCLFACHRRRPGVPVGVVVYLRTSADLLQILHLVVHPAYEQHGQRGQHAALGLTRQLVGEVRALARRIGGVRRVQLPYGRGACIRVPRPGD